MHDSITRLAAEIAETVTGIRRDIHSHPETKYAETRTAGVVRDFLDGIGVRHRTYAGTGVAADIGTGPGRTVALRSEMDALPMPDSSGTSWASVHDGVAHTCGHDGHIAILLGTAWVLQRLEPELRGTVRLLWQPAEEGGAGALRMIEDGALGDPLPEAIFALHGWPGLPVGNIGYRFGPAMASVDDFELTVTGRGAHGAMPHTGVDPIVIAARVIEGIQHVRSRMLDPLDPAVVTVATIHGGTAVNIIPDRVTMTGTIRTLDPETRQRIPDLVRTMAAETARASGGEALFTITNGYPPTINENRATAFVRDITAATLGPDRVVEIPRPTMGGEDFAYYLERIPGSFLRLGVGDRPPLHNGAYDFNDAAIPTGIRVMTGIAAAFLERGFPAD